MIMKIRDDDDDEEGDIEDGRGHIKEQNRTEQDRTDQIRIGQDRMEWIRATQITAEE